MPKVEVPEFAKSQILPGTCTKCKSGRMVHSNRVCGTVYTGMVRCRGCGHTYNFIDFVGLSELRVFHDVSKDQLSFLIPGERSIDV